MKLTTREEVKAAIDAGQTIYQVHGLGSSSQSSSIDLKGAFFVLHEGIGEEVRTPAQPYAHFFMGDFNITAHHNHHYLFTEESEAAEYLAWAQTNTPEIDKSWDFFDDPDYYDDRYEYEGDDHDRARFYEDEQYV